jgi:uncharacterized protein YegL
MMRSDLTDVTVVLDRSGSMAVCKVEAEDGVNHFIESQRKQPGDCRFSLVQFDTTYEFVYSNVPIADVPKYSLVPRGMTALLDAVGMAIKTAGVRLAAMDEADRPCLVVFVIVTDGQENASREFTKLQIKEMIEQQRAVYKWQFTFLGANQDAFAEASGLGIAPGAAAGYNTKSSAMAFVGASENVKRMRSDAAAGLEVRCEYTQGERASMG